MPISVAETAISVLMTPADLMTWRKDLGLTQRKAAEKLGYGLTQYGAMERAPSISVLPISVALACAAISAGLPPYPEAKPDP